LGGKMKRLFYVVFFLFSYTLNSQTKNDVNQWQEIIKMLDLTPLQSYTLIKIYKGDMDKISTEIYKSAEKYLKQNKIESEEDLFKATLINEMIGDLDNAIFNISKAIEKNPKESKYYYTLGRLYSNKGDFSKALTNLKKSSELKPENPYVWYELFQLYKNTPESNKAIENLEKFIKLAPSSYFKGMATDYACKQMVLEKKLEVSGCPPSSEYNKIGFKINISQSKLPEKQKNIDTSCCEYECETYKTKCCEEEECTDYDYYTGECINYKCKKWIDCEKEKCKCTKICE